MSAARHTRLPALVTALTVVALGLAACGGDPLDSSSGSGSDSDTIVVGSANFLENELLAQMYAQALEAGGFTVDTSLNVGSREVLYQAMEDGSIDVLPEYNGALLSYLDVDDTSTTSDAVDAAITALLPANFAILDDSPAEDKNTVVVTQATADQYDLSTLADLAPVAPQFTFGAAPEDQERYQGLVGLQQVYGLNFAEFRALDTAGPLTITALQDGDVQAGILYSTTPQIETENFVVLDDPENVFGVQNIVPLVNTDTVPAAAQDILDKISAALDTETLTALNARVQIDLEDPAAVAKDWLEQNGII